jgi:type IV secretion system protein VirB9
LNFAWAARGAPELVPGRVFEDGEALFLAWPEDRALPAILAPLADGKSEEPVDYSTSGGFIVIQSPPSALHLRLGGRVAVVARAEAPAPKGRRPQAQAAPASPSSTLAVEAPRSSSISATVDAGQASSGASHGR